MNAIDAEIVEVAKTYVLDLLERELPECCLFHSTNHTLGVLKNAEIIGVQSNLSEEELNLLRVCALFHDVGYIHKYDNHEVESAAYATAFLESKQVNASSINQVVNAILATKVPHHPKDKISEILCDADLMHLTYDDYFDHIEPMRQEWKQTGRATFTQQRFELESINFFSSHHYHTDYGKKVLAPLKEVTKKKIISRVYSEERIKPEEK